MLLSQVFCSRLSVTLKVLPSARDLERQLKRMPRYPQLVSSLSVGWKKHITHAHITMTTVSLWHITLTAELSTSCCVRQLPYAMARKEKVQPVGCIRILNSSLLNQRKVTLILPGSIKYRQSHLVASPQSGKHLLAHYRLVLRHNLMFMLI